MRPATLIYTRLSVSTQEFCSSQSSPSTGFPCEQFFIKNKNVILLENVLYRILLFSAKFPRSRYRTLYTCKFRNTNSTSSRNIVMEEMYSFKNCQRSLCNANHCNADGPLRLQTYCETSHIWHRKKSQTFQYTDPTKKKIWFMILPTRKPTHDFKIFFLVEKLSVTLQHRNPVEYCAFLMLTRCRCRQSVFPRVFPSR